MHIINNTYKSIIYIIHHHLKVQGAWVRFFIASSYHPVAQCPL